MALEYQVPSTFTLSDSRAYGRIDNKNTPLDDTDEIELNANFVMACLDGILGGEFRGKLKVWAVGARP